MYKGNYSSQNKKNRKRRLRWRKEFVLLCSIAVLLVGVVGSSLAYLITDTDPVVNEFEPSKVDSKVYESFDGTTKSNVCATNTSDIPAFLRATISVYWESDGDDYEVLAQTPSYTITENLNDSGWFKVGDIYYYSQVVAAGATTPNAFINSIVVNGTAPDGYHLVVDVLTEAIQAEGVNTDGSKHPVEIAWGVKYNAGTPATISAS